MTTKIIFIDRFISYSTKMYLSLEKIISEKQKFTIQFLGPSDSKKLLFSTQEIPNSKKVWSSNNYIRKIFSYSIQNESNIVHLVFEYNTFGNFFSALRFPFLLLLLRTRKIKLVVTLHNVWIYKNKDRWEVPDYFPLILPKFFLKLFIKSFFSFVCKLSDHIVVGTNEAKQCIIDFYGISNEKVSVIHFGTSANSEIFNNEKKIKFRELFSNKKILLCFGVISARKNQEFIIKSFSKIAKKLPNHILVIAGTAATSEFKSYETHLHELVSSLNLEKSVVFTGYLDDDEVDILFDMADVSLYMYRPMSDSTFALTFAMYHHKPVIVSDLPIFHEILDDESCIFVDPDNETRLSEAMLKICLTPELQESFIEKMEIISKKFTWEKSALEHLKIYNNLS